MTTYKNLSKRSGVAEYDVDPENNHIDVTFKNGGKYRYPVDGNGAFTISKMAALGDHGEFLNRFINKNQPSFERLNQGDKSGYRQHDNKVDEGKVDKIHQRFLSSNKGFKDSVKAALVSKQTDLASWKNQRNELNKFKKR
jgi:hypothetical protein